MILVVGGAGYIGSHICLRMRQLGWDHAALDNFERGHVEALEETPWHRADLRDELSLLEVIREVRPTAVIHMAAYIEVGESVLDPNAFYRNNVLGSANLLRALVEVGSPPVVFSSTAAVYGEPQQIPISESHPLHPTNPYGWSKLAVEGLLAASSGFGMRSICLRYFNACGGDPSGRIGESHFPETHLIPLAVQSAMGLRGPLTVFGTDWDTPDGTCLRDYVHVLDLAEAHLRAVEHLHSGGESGIFNLGTGAGISVREVLDGVSDVCGPVPALEGERRLGDPARLIADARLAKETLGWEAKRTDLGETIREVAAWQKSPRYGRKI